MTEVDVRPLSDVAQQPFEAENITGAILTATRFASVTFGTVAPRSAQTHHRQHRPQDGDEIILVYSGVFGLRTSAGESAIFEVAEVGPVYVYVPARTAASIINFGSTPVSFFSVFAPPFEQGEIEYLDR